MICIPPKDNELCVMNVFDTYTGENFGHIDGIQDVTITSEFKTDYARDKNGDKVLLYKHDLTYEMTFNADKEIDKEEFYKIFGIDTGKMPDAYTIQYIKSVQARKHKKKRINKKWLKRYGYKQMIVESKGWKLKSDTDGNVKFVK